MSKRERDARYYLKHKQAITARRLQQSREYCRRPEVVAHRQAYNRLRNTGVSPEQFEAKLREQNQCCGLCGLPFTHTQKKQADHDHVTGKFRGVLHHRCNLGIGSLNDDPILLAKATRYLLQFIPTGDANV